MKAVYIIFFSFFVVALNAQVKIDSSFAFQTDPAKQFSIYVPSGYDASEPATLMLGLHPWNPDRWNSVSWRDTLEVFAETNQLLMICPDGGNDGQVDDPIDIAFTDAILDSMHLWYNIDTAKRYVMGFSWGGRTTYTYGLDRAEYFAGYIPIGAAIDGASTLTPIAANAFEEPVFIVHGSNDLVGTRYTPAIDAMTNAGAYLNDTLLSGVGHTIDFDNRNEILTMAFEWIDSVNCALLPVDTTTMPIDTTTNPMDTITNSLQTFDLAEIKLAPSLISQFNPVLEVQSDRYLTADMLNVIDLNGKHFSFSVLDGRKIRLESGLDTGIYIVQFLGDEGVVRSAKFVVY